MPSSDPGGPSAISVSAAIASSTARVAEGDLDPLAADLALELVGGALGDQAAVVDHRDPVGEPVGLVEVLGRQQQRVAAGDVLLDRLPEADPAAGVEPGGGLVEEQDAAAGDERRGEVEAAAHAAGVRLHEPVARVVRSKRSSSSVARARERSRPRW